MIVVVGVDGSTHSLRALSRAGRIASWLGGELHVAYASHISPLLFASIEVAPLQIEEIEERERTLVWEKTEAVLAEVNPDLLVKRVDLHGYPPDAIVQYATEIGADMIVVGSRGRGSFASLLLGSTSHRVMNTANCDVLVVKGVDE